MTHTFYPLNKLDPSQGIFRFNLTSIPGIMSRAHSVLPKCFGVERRDATWDIHMTKFAAPDWISWITENGIDPRSYFKDHPQHGSCMRIVKNSICQPGKQ